MQVVYFRILKISYMKSLTWLLLPAFFLTACSHTYYVVRHAEKASADSTMAAATMTGADVPLSERGAQRANALRDVLRNRKIAFIYSTNTIRTRSTGQPTADVAHLRIQLYKTPDSAFISKMKSIKKNVLIIGHSNTVDDIVNSLTGSVSVPGDLKDNEYDNLFVIKYRGKKITFDKKKYGAPSAGK